MLISEVCRSSMKMPTEGWEFFGFEQKRDISKPEMYQFSPTESTQLIEKQ